LHGNFCAATRTIEPVTQGLVHKPAMKTVLPLPCGAGGCDFAVDPAIRAIDAELFWLPEWSTSVVILTASRVQHPALTFSPSDWPGLRARRAAQDGEHFILKSGSDEFQLWLPDPPDETSYLAAVIPIDEMAPQRLAVTMRFWRHATGQRPSAGAPAPKRRQRIDHALRALDGHMAGASYRDIAESLFGSQRVGAEPWKTSPLRDSTIRLVRGGVALMRGGYRKFLRR